MLVSIVLPVYNGARTLLKALQSCSGQSYRNLEIIVVNDGSTDETSHIVKTFSQVDQRIRLVEQKRAGVAHAFNKGIETARGTYIARMDADDVMHPGKIERQVEFIEAHPETGVVSCLVNYGGDRTTQEGYALHVDWINTLITPEQIALNRFVDSPVCNPTVLFRKESVGRYGAALQGDFPEDYEMWLRWMDQGVKFAKIPEVLFTWNDLPSRLTRNDSRYSPQAFEQIKASYLLDFIRRNNSANRQIYLCGTGRITRRKSDFLVKEISTRGNNCMIGAYLEIDPAKIGTTCNGIPVCGLDELPPRTEAYVVNYVSVRGAREELRQIFLAKGFTEGADFVMAG